MRKKGLLHPPVAPRKMVLLEKHGTTREDPYYWLRERENPETIEYLRAENTYAEVMTSRTRKLRGELFDEIKNRIKQTDMSVPHRFDDFFYYTRYECDRAYPIYCRRLESMTAPEQTILDVNELARGESFYHLEDYEISSGQDILSYAFDTTGRRIHTIHFKNLESGETLQDRIEDVTGDMAWANDNRTLFYTKQDPLTLRSFQVFRHRLGSDSSEDVLIYEEDDETFSVSVSRTKSKQYILISCLQTLTSEFHFLRADDAEGTFEVFEPRERGHEYEVDHLGEFFYIRTNLAAVNFRLMRSHVSQTARCHWKEIIRHREDVFLSDFELFEDFLVCSERREGLDQICVQRWDGSDQHDLEFQEPAYVAELGTNPQMATPVVRYLYSSMTTPPTTFDYDMVKRTTQLIKQEEVKGFHGQDYVTERLEATGRDGVSIPISLVYRKGIPLAGHSPLLLYGYGAYGYTLSPAFSAARVSLLDRGFVFAMAHVRGGGELGRPWTEAGRLLKKKNSFYDFIDCAEFLVSCGYSDPQRLFAHGASAGGLLVGTVMNMRADLFRAVVAQVPFVDIVTTMSDESIPLTTSEYDEWGDPGEREFFQYMLSYSPYDNVSPQDYPALLVTAGLHDSQVQYWEPAKWVAKLRATKTDSNDLILKTDLESGHSGASGRYKRYEEIAFLYAFLIDQAGLGPAS